jgi:hypothetical protein
VLNINVQQSKKTIKMKNLNNFLSKMANPVIATLACLIFASVVLVSMKSKETKHKGDKRIAYGPSVQTHDLHNTYCSYCNGANFEHGCFDKFRFGKHILTVTTDAGYTFTGDPFVHCVTDNDGSFGWNNFPGAHDRFIVTERDANRIVAIVYAGSRQITINLACEETAN